MKEIEEGKKFIVVGNGDGYGHGTRHGFKRGEIVTVLKIFSDGDLWAEAEEGGLCQIVEPCQLAEYREPKPSKLKEYFWVAVAVVVMLAVMAAESLLDMAMAYFK